MVRTLDPISVVTSGLNGGKDHLQVVKLEIGTVQTARTRENSDD